MKRRKRLWQFIGVRFQLIRNHALADDSHMRIIASYPDNETNSCGLLFNL